MIQRTYVERNPAIGFCRNRYVQILGERFAKMGRLAYNGGELWFGLVTILQIYCLWA